jgi:hypothetical protein
VTTRALPAGATDWQARAGFLVSNRQPGLTSAFLDLRVEGSIGVIFGIECAERYVLSGSLGRKLLNP